MIRPLQSYKMIRLIKCVSQQWHSFGSKFVGSDQAYDVKTITQTDGSFPMD